MKKDVQSAQETEISDNDRSLKWAEGVHRQEKRACKYYEEPL